MTEFNKACESRFAMVVRATQHTGFSMPKSLRDKIERMARADRRSLSKMLVILLEESVAHRESAESLKNSEKLIVGRENLPLNQ